MVVLWSGSTSSIPAGVTAAEYVNATVTTVEQGPCIVPTGNVDCTVISFGVEEGLGAGTTFTTEYSDANTFIPDLRAGDAVVLGEQLDVPDERFRYFFADYQRGNQLLLLAALFAVAIVALGGLVGVRSLISLAVSMFVLIGFMLPAMLSGGPPVLIALVGSAAVAFIALFFTHGFNHLTAVSILGSFASLAVTGLLAWIFIRFTSLTGLTDENAAFLRFGSSELSLRGLLLAGVVIGTLGVLDDVTVTQASTVSEVHNANPAYSFGQLYASGVRVGRAHIASTVNTLVLAYAGAALPLLLLFNGTGQSLGRVATSEVVAVEIVRTLVGSIGLVAAIPLTTALAAWVVRHEGATFGSAGFDPGAFDADDGRDHDHDGHDHDHDDDHGSA